MDCPLSFAESKHQETAQSIYPLLYEIEATSPRIIALNRRFDDPRPVAPRPAYDIKGIGRAAVDRIKVFHNYFSPEGLAADGIIAVGKTEQRPDQGNKQSASDDPDRRPALRSQRLRSNHDIIALQQLNSPGNEIEAGCQIRIDRYDPVRPRE
jgi:hypothetical protein